MNRQKITIKALSEQIAQIDKRAPKWCNKDTAQTFKKIIWYASNIKRIGGKMELADGYLVFSYQNGSGKIPANDPSIESVLLPYLTEIFKA